MILSRAPTRITLGGGGTDLESYYSKFGGFLIAGGINKYCTVLANQRFYNTIRLSYSQLEIVDQVDKIQHRIFRAALETINVETNIELHSTADVPAGSGLGSSSSFTVALLNALHAYKRDFVTQRQLAEEACHIEIEKLGQPIGKQDQYMAALGGLICLTFEKNGDVIAEPLRITPDAMDQLESSLTMFFTGSERNASDVLREQDANTKKDDQGMIQNLHRTKDIGLQTRKYMESGNLDMLGELFHEHWGNKKKRSTGMTNPFIDESYEIARKHGAIGGKLVGAGGSGFLMFYIKNDSKAKVIEALQRKGLRWMRFHFDFEGAKILVNT